MAIDDVLDGMDPYDLMDAEAARIEAFVGGLDADAWAQPSRCAGWSRRDLLGHLASTEEYFHAGLEGTVGDLFMAFAERGVTDVHTANAWGVESRASVPAAELVATWAADCATTRTGMRARDGGDVDTSVGAYPCRLQAFHIAGELATHADDLGVPVTAEEAPARLDWRTRFSCSLAETKDGVTATPEGDEVHVSGPDLDVRLDRATFVAAVAGRLGDDDSLDPAVRALLDTMP